MEESRILYEDNHLIAVNKKIGELVQGDDTGDDPMTVFLKEYIKIKYNKPGNVFLGVAHRIDRPVSGVVVFARTSKALTRLNAMFQEKTSQKTYLAIVKNKPPKDTDHLFHWMVRNQKQNKSYCHEKQVPDSKKAELIYTIKASSDNYHLLEIKLITGRHHQIRSQLSKIGCPIKGDLKYGFDRSNPDGGIDLHAYSIEFEHPVKKEPLKIVAPLPEGALWRFFEGKVI
ncbi:MAG: RNA pseudouridine synthase [Bacteroidetes bacterium GWF2_38_335]|nr:MAG: RNA pseudouridine synthase [Bacteroidetes bacterium GWF2_38_335]OFY77548.1 MAG: RNA pseudouridine synthase [Bacteroidetes bacterium RIFOXYA12_FULL_38_20]HBS87155.1 RNA pseudouridine synthase [Bacteroidales bacterium]